jgi:hypothetical protein
MILPDLLGAEDGGRAVEVLGEPPDRTDVGTCGSLRLITAFEFIEHTAESWVGADGGVDNEIPSAAHVAVVM